MENKKFIEHTIKKLQNNQCYGNFTYKNKEIFSKIIKNIKSYKKAYIIYMDSDSIHFIRKGKNIKKYYTISIINNDFIVKYLKVRFLGNINKNSLYIDFNVLFPIFIQLKEIIRKKINVFNIMNLNNLKKHYNNGLKEFSIYIDKRDD